MALVKNVISRISDNLFICRIVVLLAAGILGLTATVGGDELSPALEKQNLEFNRKAQQLSNDLQKEMGACGSDMACRMQAVSRFQSALAQIPLPENPAYKSTDCGLMATAWEDCIPLQLEIQYSFDENIYDIFNDVKYCSSLRSLAFKYTVDGVLGYNGDLETFRLYQLHPPILKDVQFQDGRYTTWAMGEGGATKDTDLSLSQANWTDPDSLVCFLEVKNESPGATGRLEFYPPTPVAGPNFEDRISGNPIPPDGYDMADVTNEALRPLLQPGGEWAYSNSFHKDYDAMGSRYILNFSVKAKSGATVNTAPALKKAGKDKNPAQLQVSPVSGFTARRSSKKDLYKPRNKVYTLRNTGDEPLSFKVSSGASWLAAETVSGFIGPKGSTAVTISLTGTADALQGAKHDTIVRFANLTNQKGTTSRNVSLRDGEKWRFSYYGYDQETIAGGKIAGGLVVFWRTDVDFEVEDGKYKSGQGRSYLVKVNPFSKPQGIFDCITVNGTYIDQNLNVHKTPYVTNASFPVSGHVKGNQVDLYFSMKQNEYHIHFQCLMDTDASKDKGYMAQKTNFENIHEGVGTVTPQGSKSYPLQDGWHHDAGVKGKSINYEASEMKRLE